jgi:hypothetical protein
LLVNYKKNMSTPRPKTLTLALDDEAREQLANLARDRGFFKGKAPSVNQLVEAIAFGQVPLAQPLRKNLQKVIAEVIASTNNHECALELSQFLLSRSDVLFEYQEIAQKFAEVNDRPLMASLKNAIAQQQPFTLFYRDAAAKDWNFTVRYAHLSLIEDRTYLNCWCEEAEGNLDLPGLQNNRVFRLDRIQDAGIVPTEGKWRSQGLDSIPAEILLYRGLAYAYEPHPEDISQQWVSNDPPTKKIVRSITSSFWFIRKTLPYGKDAQVIAPPELRDRIHQHLTEAARLYE